MPKKKYSKRLPTQSWKGLKRKRKVKRLARNLALSLVVIFSSILCICLYTFFKNFHRNGVQAAPRQDLGRVISGGTGFAVFVAQRSEGDLKEAPWNEFGLLVFNKAAKKLAFFKLPYDFEVATRSFGSVKLSSYGKVAFGQETEDNPWINLEDALGVPLEGVIVAPKGFFKGGFSELDFLSLMRGGDEVYTNLSLWNLADLAFFYSGLLESEILEADYNPSLLPPYLGRDDFMKEAVRLALANGSGDAGLASKEAAKLSLLGLSVSQLSDWPAGDLAGNLLVLSSKNLSDLKTVSYLKARYSAKVSFVVDSPCPVTLVLTDLSQVF